MKLNEYLEENGIAISKFARIAKLSYATVHNILDKKRDLRLSVALKIEDATKKQVTCRELLPEQFFKLPKQTLSMSRKKKKTTETSEEENKNV